MPDWNVAVRSTLPIVGGPPAATLLVCTAIPFMVQTTTSGPPAASATSTDTVALAPDGGAQLMVVGAAGQVMFKVLFCTVTGIEQEAEQPSASVAKSLMA